MNKEKILAVAKAIESGKFKSLKFGMETFCTDEDQRAACGTAACVAGWAYALEHGVKILKKADLNDIEYGAADFLDLSGKQASMLFYADEGNRWQDYENRDLNEVTREQAVWALRQLAETGEVPRWPWKE